MKIKSEIRQIKSNLEYVIEKRKKASHFNNSKIPMPDPYLSMYMNALSDLKNHPFVFWLKTKFIKKYKCFGIKKKALK